MSATHGACLNVYQDTHTGGWIRKVCALGEWYVAGVYGTRAAALGGGAPT
jgi:hypothetical protein